MSSNTDVTSVSTLGHYVGRVKWFNNKAGYGFITVTDGDRSGSDIFVHHSSIGVSSQQYKYLVQGEYVEFELVTLNGGSHAFQASNVNGIKGGKLMCETRYEFKIARTNYKNNKDTGDVVVDSVDTRALLQKTKTRSRGEGPRDGEQKGWTVVSSGSPAKKSSTGRPRGRPPRQVVSSEEQ